MADTKISALTPLGSLSANNLLHTVNDPTGTPVNQSVRADVLIPTIAATAGETAAAVTIVNNAYPPGHILRYGTNTTPGTTDMLAAFNAAHDQFDETASVNFGGTVTIPEGDFYLSDTWHIQKQLNVKGAGAGSHVASSGTRLLFPVDTDGIHIHSSVEPGYNSGHNTKIRDLCLDGDNGGTTGHGVKMTDRAHLYNLKIQGFSENGIHIFGGSVDTTGTPNQWTVTDCDSEVNDGHGIYVDGPDTNAGLCLGSNFKSNGAWGIYDSSFLGNTYVGCHLNDNGTGSVKTEGDVNECVFIGTYIEGAGAYGVELDPPTMWFGGVGAGTLNSPLITITGDGSGAACRANLIGGAVDSVQITAEGSGYTSAAAAIAATQHGSGSGATFTPNIVGGKITSVTVDAGGSGYDGNANAAATFRHNGTPGGFTTNETWFRKRTQSVTDGYLKMMAAADALINVSYVGATGAEINLCKWDDSDKTYNIATGNSDALANVSRRLLTADATGHTGGRSATPTQGSLMYPNGLWLGDGTTGRHLSSSASMPSSGEYAKGDFVFNTNVSEAGSPAYVILGWSRLVTGSNHVLNTDWVTMRCVTGN